MDGSKNPRSTSPLASASLSAAALLPLTFAPSNQGHGRAPDPVQGTRSVAEHKARLEAHRIAVEAATAAEASLSSNFTPVFRKYQQERAIRNQERRRASSSKFQVQKAAVASPPTITPTTSTENAADSKTSITNVDNVAEVAGSKASIFEDFKFNIDNLVKATGSKAPSDSAVNTEDTVDFQTPIFGFNLSNITEAAEPKVPFHSISTTGEAAGSKGPIDNTKSLGETAGSDTPIFKFNTNNIAMTADNTTQGGMAHSKNKNKNKNKTKANHSTRDLHNANSMQVTTCNTPRKVTGTDNELESTNIRSGDNAHHAAPSSSASPAQASTASLSLSVNPTSPVKPHEIRGQGELGHALDVPSPATPATRNFDDKLHGDKSKAHPSASHLLCFPEHTAQPPLPPSPSDAPSNCRRPTRINDDRVLTTMPGKDEVVEESEKKDETIKQLNQKLTDKSRRYDDLWDSAVSKDKKISELEDALKKFQQEVTSVKKQQELSKSETLTILGEKNDLQRKLEDRQDKSSDRQTTIIRAQEKKIKELEGLAQADAGRIEDLEEKSKKQRKEIRDKEALVVAAEEKQRELEAVLQEAQTASAKLEEAGIFLETVNKDLESSFASLGQDLTAANVVKRIKELEQEQQHLNRAASATSLKSASSSTDGPAFGGALPKNRRNFSLADELEDDEGEEEEEEEEDTAAADDEPTISIPQRDVPTNNFADGGSDVEDGGESQSHHHPVGKNDKKDDSGRPEQIGIATPSEVEMLRAKATQLEPAIAEISRLQKELVAAQMPVGGPDVVQVDREKKVWVPLPWWFWPLMGTFLLLCFFFGYGGMQERARWLSANVSPELVRVGASPPSLAGLLGWPSPYGHGRAFVG